MSEAMLTDSLVDLSTSEILILAGVALSQREKEAKRAGLVKFWVGIYCLLRDELRRRKKEVENIELEMLDMEEPIVEWTGKPDPDPSQNIQVLIDPPDYEDPPDPEKG